MEKKISFGFSKLAKKPQLVAPVVKADDETQKIEFIECLEGQSIKIAGKPDDDVAEAPLVIPMAANTTPLEKVKQLREENKPHLKNNPTADPPNETLEQRAAREIIENLKAAEDAEQSASTFTVPLKPDEVKLGGAQASTMDDYENVPIAHFGLAMLRGMGWKDEEHKEKGKKKGFEDDIVVCRPKGLGLGADKAMKQQVKLAAHSTSSDEKLIMKRGAYVRVLAGRSKDFYGQVEGLDEESGRVFIKMALGGQRESVNEAFVQLVTEKEFKENRKVLNVSKYEEYKMKEGKGSSDRDGTAEDRLRDRRDTNGESSGSSNSNRRNDYTEKRASHHDERSRQDRRQRERSRTRSPEARREDSSKSSSDRNRSYRHDNYTDDDEDDGGKRSHREKRRDRSKSREGRSRRGQGHDDYNRRHKGRTDDEYRSRQDDNGRRRDR